MPAGVRLRVSLGNWVSRAFYRGAGSDLERLATLPALPETIDEVRAVGASLGANEEDLKLGAQATEAAVKQAQLNQYRVVYFATHGLGAGQTAEVAKGTAEPALVFLKSTENSYDAR